MERHKPKDLPTPSEEQIQRQRAASEEYISMWQGNVISYNRIKDGHPMLQTTLDSLLNHSGKEGKVLGNHAFEFTEDGDVVYDIKMWIPEEMRKKYGQDIELPEGVPVNLSLGNEGGI